MFSKLWRSLVVIILAFFPSSLSFAAGPQSSPEDKWQYTNHLINETSPYLLQHAHNPVEWYPWGEEAFAKARKENKSIFLSIGYSTSARPRSADSKPSTPRLPLNFSSPNIGTRSANR